jgi:hypothetical protein
MRDHCTGADHGEASDHDVRQYDRACSYAGSATDAYVTDAPVIRAFQFTLRRDGAWGFVIGENGVRPDEHAVLDFGTVVDGGVVLDFAARANRNSGIDVNILTYDDLTADTCSVTDLRMIPDARSIADPR